MESKIRKRKVAQFLRNLGGCDAGFKKIKDSISIIKSIKYHVVVFEVYFEYGNIDETTNGIDGETRLKEVANVLKIFDEYNLVSDGMVLYNVSFEADGENLVLVYTSNKNPDCKELEIFKVSWYE